MTLTEPQRNALEGASYLVVGAVYPELAQMSNAERMKLEQELTLALVETAVRVLSEAKERE